MDATDHVYTVGMTAAEVESYLRGRQAGVLSLASDDDAYAVPVSYFYDGTSVFVRLGEGGDESRKMAFVESTDEACFVVFDVEDEESWSVLVRGTLRAVSDPHARGFDDAAIAERFGPLRVFDEPIEEIELVLFELDVDTIVGRRTEL
ncbi:pyridoxamine 5'-phosphate oxidase family protein [Halorubrum sp. DTA98]|uniref:pyridoxamine 5'-phosphate oxidase family protein n=1 Tax=Halorubrum sp. DTA98 TaxID=3402163 RepID=UPI003AAC08FB